MCPGLPGSSGLTWHDRHMRHDYPHLLSPLDLGRFEVRNRFVMGSMHTGLEDRPGDAKKLAAYLGERARGGVGLIVTGGYSPDRTGRLTPRGAQEIGRASRRESVAAQARGGRVYRQRR